MTPAAPNASVTARLEDALERETPNWGIRPVPGSLRRFSGLDLAVLWGDLSIGLLVLVSGALLVPALGLPMAALAIVIGTAIGCVPLGLVAAAGARDGVPSMVLFRPVLGLRGSYVPSVANLVQLIGWTAFEFWAMGRIANAVSIDLFGIDAPFVWILVVAVVCTALALAGPDLHRPPVARALRGVDRGGGRRLDHREGPRRGGHRCRLVASGSRRAPVLVGGRPRDRDAHLLAPAGGGLLAVRAGAAGRVRGHGRRLRARQRLVLPAGRACSCSRRERARTCSTSAPRSRRRPAAAWSSSRSWSASPTTRWPTSTRRRSPCRTRDPRGRSER